MSERYRKVWAVLGVVIVAVSLLFRWQFAVGYVIGAAVSRLLFWRNETFWSDVLDTRVPVGGGGHFMVNYLLMALAMIPGALFPRYINIFGCALGLISVKLAIVLSETVGKKEEDHDRSE